MHLHRIARPRDPHTRRRLARLHCLYRRAVALLTDRRTDSATVFSGGYHSRVSRCLCWSHRGKRASSLGKRKKVRHHTPVVLATLSFARFNPSVESKSTRTQIKKSKNQSQSSSSKKTPLRMRHSPVGVAVLSTSFIANAT